MSAVKDLPGVRTNASVVRSFVGTRMSAVKDLPGVVAKPAIRKAVLFFWWCFYCSLLSTTTASDIQRQEKLLQTMFTLCFKFTNITNLIKARQTSLWLVYIHNKEHTISPALHDPGFGRS